MKNKLKKPRLLANDTTDAFQDTFDSYFRGYDDNDVHVISPWIC